MEGILLTIFTIITIIICLLTIFLVGAVVWMFIIIIKEILNKRR